MLFISVGVGTWVSVDLFLSQYNTKEACVQFSDLKLYSICDVSRMSCQEALSVICKEAVWSWSNEVYLISPSKSCVYWGFLLEV